MKTHSMKEVVRKTNLSLPTLKRKKNKPRKKDSYNG